MQQEEITLTSGEVLRMERREFKSTSSHSINIWTMDDPDIIATVGKEWRAVRGVPVWEPAVIRSHPIGTTVETMPRHIEILQHAARLATELDEQFVPGTEVTG